MAEGQQQVAVDALIDDVAIHGAFEGCLSTYDRDVALDQAPSLKLHLAAQDHQVILKALTRLEGVFAAEHGVAAAMIRPNGQGQG